MEIFFIYLFMGSLAAYALYLTFRGRSQVIVDPILGFLNLGGERFAALIAEDQAVLSPLFPKSESANGDAVPKCNVLFVYAELASDGSLGFGKDRTIRHLADNAGASIVVLASNNRAEDGIAAANLPGPKRANLAFPQFFKELFTRMKAGKPMPIAWNAISPQYKSDKHANLPETFCQLEAGQVRFR